MTAVHHFRGPRQRSIVGLSGSHPQPTIFKDKRHDTANRLGKQGGAAVAQPGYHRLDRAETFALSLSGKGEKPAEEGGQAGTATDGNGRTRRDPEGLLAGQPSNLSLDDLTAARREAWRGFGREGR